MNPKIQQYAIEIISTLSTVFGTWYISSLLLGYTDEQTFNGYGLLLIQLVYYGVWFVFSAFLISLAHPAPNRMRLLAIASLISLILILASQGWTEPELDFMTKLTIWFEVYLPYLIVVPIFFIAGYYSENKNESNSGHP